MKPCKKCLKNERFKGRTICLPCINKEERLKVKARLEKKKEKRKIKREKNRESFKYLHKKAWDLISIHVRTKGIDENGFNSCYTCGVRKYWNELQCGHYHHGDLDFDTRNLRPQCPRCNKNLHGNLSVYGTKLAQEYGAEGMAKLYLDANTTIYQVEDLKEVIKKYENR